MKILFVNPVGVIGGAERAILTFMEALFKHQTNLEIFLIVGTSGSMVEAAEKLGVTVEVMPLPEQFNRLGDSALRGKNKLATLVNLLALALIALPGLYKYITKLRSRVRKLKPDIIHSNGIKAHLLTSVVKSSQTPLVWHIQDFYGSRPLMAKVLGWSSNRASLGIAISQAVAVDAKTCLPNLPIQVIYHATDINHFSPIAPVPHHPLRVGLVATFARWKGHDIFLQAIAILHRTRPEVEAKFYIVGGPIYATQGSQFSQEELAEQAQQLGITDRITFLGFQANVVETYRWLDIVVHASTQPEPFGLAIIEAMACGKPVIVARAGGAAELFTQAHDAVGVPPGDPQALATAIANLLEDEEKRQRLGIEARKTILEKFSHQRLGKQLMDCYQELMG